MTTATIRQIEERLAAVGIVRTPVEWVTDDHAALFPDHLRQCQRCYRTFDAEVVRSTGLHKAPDSGGRPPKWCSDRCENAGREERRAARRREAGEQDAAAYATTRAQRPDPRPAFADVRAVLNYVRRELAYGRWTGIDLLRSEWAMLDASAPEVSKGLVWYEHWIDAQRDGLRLLARRGAEARAEELAARVVATIDQWFIDGGAA